MTKICSLYILRLLAGKFGTICTAFPPTTLWAKNSKYLPLQFLLKNNFITSCEKVESKTLFSFLHVSKTIRKRYFNLVTCLNQILNRANLFSETIGFSNSFARDDVSDKNLFPMFLICTTGQIKPKKKKFYLS